MTPEQQAAYIFAQAACMLADMAAMQAENSAAVRMGAPEPHDGDAFRRLPLAYGVHQNAVIGWFR